MLLSMGTATGMATATDAPAIASEDAVLRASRGDRRAYEALYRAHCGHIYALCLRMTASKAEAEDATQDAFVTAWTKLASFRGDSAFSSWLHRIAVNTVLTRMRRNKREVAHLQALPPPVTETRESDHALPDLERAIGELPMRARQVFVLVGVYGYSHEQAADTLEIAIGTCKAHLHRARQLLKDQLDENDD